MKIVIEGARCTGKSTLAAKLNELTGAAVYHATSKTDNTLMWHMSQLLSGEDKILDRFQIGEIVYSHYYGRDPRLLIREMFMMPNLVNDALFVILYAGEGHRDLFEERLYRRAIETGRTLEPDDINEAVTANKWFTVIGKMMTLENSNILMIDTETTHEDDVFEEVKNEIIRRNLW